jgi:uncharacterized protein YceK
MRAPFFAIASLLVLWLCGCGTVTNLVPSPKAKWGPVYRDENGDTEDLLLEAYGGIKNDTWCLKRVWGSDEPVMSVAKWVICPIIALDYPLTFVGDTLMLPITAPVSAMRSFSFYYFPPPKAFRLGWRYYIPESSTDKATTDSNSSPDP